MPELIVYDKAKWHLESESWPSALAREQAFVHTGFFLGWLVENGFMSQSWLDDFGELQVAFVAREWTGAQLLRMMDGSLTSEDLSDDGNAFAQAYFDFDEGVYLEDYEDLLAAGVSSIYEVPDSWRGYGILRERLSRRLQEWREGVLPRKGTEEAGQRRGDKSPE